MIKGLYETHIHVADLDRSVAFYRDVLGLEVAYNQDERRVMFFWIGNTRQQMLGVWERPADQIRREHFAFETSLDDMRQARQYLLDLGIQPRNFLDTPDAEPQVFGWMPAVALYFQDPDEHSLEFIAVLPDEAQPDLGIVAWAEWERRHGRSLSDSDKS